MKSLLETLNESSFQGKSMCSDDPAEIKRAWKDLKVLPGHDLMGGGCLIYHGFAKANDKAGINKIRKDAKAAFAAVNKNVDDTGLMYDGIDELIGEGDLREDDFVCACLMNGGETAFIALSGSYGANVCI